MPSIRNTTTLTLGAVNANVLQGSQFEFLGAPSRVQVYAMQDSAGGGGVGEAEVFFGQELELAQTRVNLRTPADVRVPDDLIVDDIGAAGDRLVVRLTETGGALTAVVVTLVKITPIAMR
jgi:hypothetical protein